MAAVDSIVLFVNFYHTPRQQHCEDSLHRGPCREKLISQTDKNIHLLVCNSTTTIFTKCC